MEEHERIKRQSLESAVEDKIRRQVKQVLDAAQVSGCGLVLRGVVLYIFGCTSERAELLGVALSSIGDNYSSTPYRYDTVGGSDIYYI